MPRKVTAQPDSTGTSVIGVIYDSGVLIAADHLASYGSLARFLHSPRVVKVNETTVLGCGGDYADFQHVSSMIEQKQIDEETSNDGFSLSPKALYSWLTRLQYNKRSKMDPFWNTWIVGGMQEGKPFIGFVDMLGTAFKEKAVASGFGAYLATPILRDVFEQKESITEAEGKALIEKCMKVLYSRDSRAYYKYQIAKVNSEGATIEGPFEVKPDWSMAPYVVGYE